MCALVGSLSPSSTARVISEMYTTETDACVAKRHMEGSDDDDEPQALTFMDAEQQAAAEAAAAAIAAAEEAEEEEEREAKRRKRKAPAKNAPLDADGLPMEWDADAGAWVSTVGFTAGPEKLSEQWVQTRKSQTKMHLEKLRSGGGVHGTSLLTMDEVREAEEVLNFALAAVLHDPAAAKGLATASAIFWAIALAQSAAAKRTGGWVVDSEDAREVWDMDYLWDYMSNFKSEVSKVDETGGAGAGGPATKVGGAKGRGGGGRGRGRGGGGAGAGSFKGAGGGDEAVKRRRLRVDNLGDDSARREKLAALDQLIRLANGAGLAAPILNLQPPAVRFLVQPSAEALEAASAALPGSAANPGGRGGARAAALARHASKVSGATQQRLGVVAPVLAAASQPMAREDDDDDLLEDALASPETKTVGEPSMEVVSAPPAASLASAATDDDGLLDMLGE